MDKQRMEIIMPARANISKSRKKIEPDLFLSDLLHVNPIADKRISKTKNKLNIPAQVNNFTRPANMFQNHKQEQYHRLNRESKIKQNDEWAALLKKSSTDNSVTSTKVKKSNYYKKLQETNQDIEDATAQLEEISWYIEEKKKEMLKNKNTSSVLNTAHPKVKNINSNTNIKHLCTKEIYSGKVKDVNSMMKYIDKHININNKNSKPRVVSQKEKNNLQRNKLNETLGLVNTKLNKVKEKYFTNDFETNRFNNIINKKPKYRSVKESMTMDKTRSSTMEASKIIQADLQNDIDNLTDSELFTMPKNNHMEVLYENADLIQKESFQDNFSDKFRTNLLHFDKISPPVTPRQLMHGSAKKYIDTHFHARNADISKEKKVAPTSRSIAVDTQPQNENKLQTSIMKSDYLMKEFGVNPDKYISTIDNIKMENIVGNSNERKKWERDLEYFMK